ncbi:DNA/RNA endonuclease G [Gluconobacter frateurii NBRC 103465]|nr:DNA/RNA endonuclease G [Gluconobacter frateurii NBRC 103465]
MRLTLFLALLTFMLTPAFADPICTEVSPGGQLPTQSNAGPVLCNQFYAAQQSLEYKEPLWSAEHLTEEGIEQAEKLQGRASFHADLRLPPGQRAELTDYKRSGWSRGHMTPSGDAPNKTSRAETYALSNVVPQSIPLNSGLWNKIERDVRSLAAKDGEVYVVTGPAFHGDAGTIGQGRVRIPTSIWKAVYDPSEGAIAVVVCKNVLQPTCGQVSVEALIRVTGVDPFPGITTPEKNKHLPIEGWPK